MVPGGYRRVGNTGVVHPATARLREQSQTAKRAPEAPARGWSGWSGAAEYPSCARPQNPPLPAVGPASLVLGSPRANSRLWANNGEI